jgi:ribosome maturation factor RimP
VSRDLSAALDVADVIPQTYRLEVSSPGIDRPMRRMVDFQRFAGQQIKVRTTDPVEGRRNFSGTIRGAENGVVEVDCEDRSYQLPLDAIARARLVPDWEAEFRRSGGRREGTQAEDSAGTTRSAGRANGIADAPGNRLTRSVS